MMMIAFHTALFSTLKQTHCAHMWLYIEWLAFCSVFLNIHQSGVLTALAWLVPLENAPVSAQVLCTPYNHAPCQFMQNHIRKVYVCLAVTCHLDFRQNDRNLLRATAVTQGWNRYQNKSQHRKLTLEKKNSKFSRRSCRVSSPQTFSHESSALTTELSAIYPRPSIRSNPHLTANESIISIRLWFTAVTAIPFHPGWADAFTRDGMAHSKWAAASWKASNYELVIIIIIIIIVLK